MSRRINRIGGTFAAAAVVVAAAASPVILHLAGSGSLSAPPLDLDGTLGRWLDQRDPGTVALVGIRLAGLVVAYHLLVTTVLALVGRALRSDRLTGIAEAWTLPPLRGAIRRVIGLGLTASLALGAPAGTGPVGSAIATAQVEPAWTPGTATMTRVGTGSSVEVEALADAAASSPASASATMRIIDSTAPRPASPLGSSATATMRIIEPMASPSASPLGSSATATMRIVEPNGTATLTILDGSEAMQSPSAPDLEEGPDDGSAHGTPADVHVVVAGDHLWSIAAAVVEADLGRSATDAEIAPYWRLVIEANPQIIDPDLIHPGDSISLPSH